MASIKKPNIEKLPSGNYRARLMINGNRVSITAETPKAVTMKYYAMLSNGQIEKQQAAVPGSMTMGECIDKYIDRRRVACSPSTIRGYVTIRNNAFPEIIDRVIMRLKDSDFQKAINNAARRLSAKTVINQWNVCGAAIREITGRDIDVKLPPIVRNEHEFLTAEQIPVFLEAIKTEKIEAQIGALLGLHSLRRSEIAHLKWEDIDLRKI